MSAPIQERYASFKEHQAILGSALVLRTVYCNTCKSVALDSNAFQLRRQLAATSSNADPEIVAASLRPSEHIKGKYAVVSTFLVTSAPWQPTPTVKSFDFSKLSAVPFSSTTEAKRATSALDICEQSSLPHNQVAKSDQLLLLSSSVSWLLFVVRFDL
jgi:hypothetical protein